MLNASRYKIFSYMFGAFPLISPSENNFYAVRLFSDCTLYKIYQLCDNFVIIIEGLFFPSCARLYCNA